MGKKIAKQKKDIVEINIGEEDKVKKEKLKSKVKKQEPKEYEPKKQEPKNIIEITDGDMILKIPKDESKIINSINILNSLLKETSKKSLKKELEELKEDVKKIEEVPEPEKEEEEKPLDVKIKRCPKCNKKLKQKTTKAGDTLIRHVKCKKRKCDFEHTFNIKI